MQSLSNKYANNQRIILAYRDFFKVILLHPAIGIATYLIVSGLMFNDTTANSAINNDFNFTYNIDIQNTLAFVSLLMLCHALLVTRFLNVEKSKDLSSWERYCSIIMFVFGICYAAVFSYLALMIGPTSFLLLTLILTTTFSLVGFMMVASKGTLLAFAAPIIISVGLVFALSQTMQGYIYCVLLLIHLGFTATASWRMCKVISNELTMRDESKDLQSKLTATEAKLNGLVITDKVSGLYTRQFFERQFVIEYRRAKRSTSSSLSVVIAEIDYFAEYETSYGTKQTEKTFSAVANVLRSITKRPGEIVAIYSNKAFVFLLPNVVAEDAEKFAHIVQQKVLDLDFPQKISKIPELSIVSVSVGIAELTDAATLSREDLLKQAEETLRPAHLTGALEDSKPSHWFTFGVKATS